MLLHDFLLWFGLKTTSLDYFNFSEKDDNEQSLEECLRRLQEKIISDQVNYFNLNRRNLLAG